MKKKEVKSPVRYRITPWKVEGAVDYDKLVKEFGTEKISPELLKRLKDMHPLLRRGLYFSHREFGSWLEDAQSGKKVSILTGRGPSEKMHLGHLVPFIIAKSFQDAYGCNVYIPISEDEKFFVKRNLSFSDALKFGEDNILDILSLGFQKGKTFILRDFSYTPLYSYASKLAKLITYSEARAIFGLTNDSNLGWTFYPAVQAAHILLPQFIEGPHKTLVPVGIDQDPFIRLTRDIAQHPAFKFTKPMALHSKFLPSLKGFTKMSSSDQEDSGVVYLSDTAEEVTKKISKHAFSGGQDTIEEHRKRGGNPEIDISFLYLKYLFEPDDKLLAKIETDYRKGKMLTSELKAYLIEKINTFLSTIQKRRSQLEGRIEDFMLEA